MRIDFCIAALAIMYFGLIDITVSWIYLWHLTFKVVKYIMKLCSWYVVHVSFVWQKNIWLLYKKEYEEAGMQEVFCRAY